MAATQRNGQARTTGARQASSGRRRADGRHTSGSRGQYYVQGNVVRKLDVTREIERQPQKKISNTTRKNREKAKNMNAGYVVFLCAALAFTGLILMNYIGLQSDITNSIQHISALESQLNQLKLENDEEYSRITSSVDLEEIKRIAIQELGMQYAEEGQVVTFASESSDYVKQMADIPD